MKKPVIYIVKNKDDAQFRYRVYNVAETLKKSKKWQAEWFLSKDIQEANKRLDETSLVVVERQTAKDNVVLDFIAKAHRSGVKVLFDLDDLIFDFRDLPLLMKTTNSKNVFYWVGYFWGIRRIAKRVDGFLCTNEFLAGKLERSFNKPVRVIPNSLNREQVELSEKLVKKKKAERESFTVGYFSGSPTHMRDFQLVEGELIRFLKDHKDAVLRVVGEMEFSREMQGWIERGRVEVVEKVDYLKLQDLVSRVDVNIAPLIVNDFTNCKSELKFFEAAVVETTTIASPAYTFAQAITDGENGYLAQPGEWYDKLEYLYKNPEKNREVALLAKKYALENYFGERFLVEVERALAFEW